jgi:hypothetical protein
MFGIKIKIQIRKPPAPPLEPDPPPWDVPLDQTTAPIHFEGDTSSV